MKHHYLKKTIFTATYIWKILLMQIKRKRGCKDSDTKNVHSNTLLLADVFKNFRNMSPEIYKLDPAKFISTLGLAWQAALNKLKVKFGL